jgi:hypothetical protein
MNSIPAVPKDEASLEQAIADKGLSAPRLTPDTINGTIAAVVYFTAAEGVAGCGDAHIVSTRVMDQLKLLTICVITLRNGFTVIGKSAVASAENYDAGIGRRVAYENARREIWPLEGYLLRERLMRYDLPTPTTKES